MARVFWNTTGFGNWYRGERSYQLGVCGMTKRMLQGGGERGRDNFFLLLAIPRARENDGAGGVH